MFESFLPVLARRRLLLRALALVLDAVRERPVCH